uniref:Putative conjugal transfer protein (TrbB) n=1 Tax=Leptospirillum ferrodiazotrophum TaxID=412449 RepID=C6HTX8_9BACT|nr:MAG: putative conjugal transfer protein (TrbB) [Leptospirillum ferrodiazotrophum]
MAELSESTKKNLVSELVHAARDWFAAFSEEGTVEIMVNPDGQVFVDRLGGGMERLGTAGRDSTLRFLATAASLSGQAVTPQSPVLETELPGMEPFFGARFEGLVPPVVSGPAFALRKRASLVFSLADYEERGIFSRGPKETEGLWYEGARSPRDLLSRAVRARRNILVVGGTGSGKTTFCNALLLEMASENGRVVMIEDTRELQCPVQNRVELRTSETVDMQKLLRATLRLRPDRIVVGEVRDFSAYTLLKAWNTGHPGGTGTIHADSALSGLSRLEQLASEGGIGTAASRPVIAEAIHCLVFIRKTSSGRRVSEILAVDGLSAGEYRTIPLLESLWSPTKGECQ